jgi:transposase
VDPAEVAALWGTRSEAEIARHFQVSERTIRGILAPMGLKHANRLRVGTVELPVHWTLEDYRAFLDLDPNLSARQAAKALGKPRNSIQLLRKRLKP